MENASKALLIAGSVMIGIMLLTLFSYLYTRLSESTASIGAELSASEVTKFNEKFLRYEGRGVVQDTEPLSVQEVATLMNLTKDCNESRKYPTTVTINLGGSNILNQYLDSKDWLDKKKLSSDTYKCIEIKTSPETRLVYEVNLMKFGT